jgi:hypothetical protein
LDAATGEPAATDNSADQSATGAESEPTPETTASDVATSEDTSSDAATNDNTTAEPPECSGPGRYERGKGGGPPSCCAGLHEVGILGAFEGENGVHVCAQPPGSVVFTCVEGECGDGVCEAGEDVSCGCVLDCPGAAWEKIADAGASAETQPITDATESIDSSDSAAAVDGGDGGEAGASEPSEDVDAPCGGIAAVCDTDEECQAFDVNLQCANHRCVRPDVTSCGGAAGTLCGVDSHLACVNLVGEWGVCLDDTTASCVCGTGLGSCYYVPAMPDAGAAGK